MSALPAGKPGKRSEVGAKVDDGINVARRGCRRTDGRNADFDVVELIANLGREGDAVVPRGRAHRALVSQMLAHLLHTQCPERGRHDFVAQP